MSKGNSKAFAVTLKRSLIGCTTSQIETARCLGLRKRHQVVEVKDTPANRGQIYKIQHLIEVEAKR